MKSRRRFLSVLAAASVGACAVDNERGFGAGGMSAAGGAGGDDMPEPNLPEGFEPVGNVSGLPIGAFVEGFGKDLLFGRDEAGVYVMTSRCTHQACNMISNDGIVSPGVIRCGCHGSEFDATGMPIHGPATTPLDHFAVAIDENGFVGVNIDEIVDPSTRAPVPS